MAQPYRNKRQSFQRKLYNSGAWQKVRAIQLATQPLCERCLLESRTTAATQVHHRLKVVKRPDLALDLANLMSVCVPCHARLDREASR